jgi:hypothetical protein
LLFQRGQALALGVELLAEALISATARRHEDKHGDGEDR